MAMAAGDGGINVRVGRLLQSARVRARVTQEDLAARVETTQQWVSRVECGAVNLRLGDAERLFGAIGLGLAVRAGRRSDESAADPDLLPEASTAGECAFFVSDCSYILRKFRAVPFVIGGRLAALAQGVRVRPLWLDLIIAESDLAAANQAMAWMTGYRWSDRNQDYTDLIFNLEAAGPRRWLLHGGQELRIEMVAERPAALTVTVDDQTLSLLPVIELLRTDPDVADLAARIATSADTTVPHGPTAPVDAARIGG